MVSWLSYLNMGIPIPRKMVFILRRGPGGYLNLKVLSYQYRDGFFNNSWSLEVLHS